MEAALHRARSQSLSIDRSSPAHSLQCRKGIRLIMQTKPYTSLLFCLNLSWLSTVFRICATLPRGTLPSLPSCPWLLHGQFSGPETHAPPILGTCWSLCPHKLSPTASKPSGSQGGRPSILGHRVIPTVISPEITFTPSLCTFNFLFK